LEDVIRLVLIFLAVGIAIIALRIISALKTAHSTRKELDDTKSAATNAGLAVTSSQTGHTLPGALEDQKTSREEKTVAPNTSGPLAGADARGGTAIQVAVPPAVSTEPDQRKTKRKLMWVDSHYCCVVLCKNHWFHLRQNLFFRHRIPLSESDPVAPRPSLDGRFRVRCDDCRKEYLYKPSEVLKSELELPDSFTPHPLFRDF
jgi:hypothetical protein